MSKKNGKTLRFIDVHRFLNENNKWNHEKNSNKWIGKVYLLDFEDPTKEHANKLISRYIVEKVDDMNKKFGNNLFSVKYIQNGWFEIILSENIVLIYEKKDLI